MLWDGYDYPISVMRKLKPERISNLPNVTQLGINRTGTWNHATLFRTHSVNHCIAHWNIISLGTEILSLTSVCHQHMHSFYKQGRFWWASEETPGTQRPCSSGTQDALKIQAHKSSIQTYSLSLYRINSSTLIQRKYGDITCGLPPYKGGSKRIPMCCEVTPKHMDPV